jgi:hypothetical protein
MVCAKGLTFIAAIASGQPNIIGIIVEALIIVWLFKSEYVKENFKKLGKKE